MAGARRAGGRAGGRGGGRGARGAQAGGPGGAPRPSQPRYRRHRACRRDWTGRPRVGVSACGARNALLVPEAHVGRAGPLAEPPPEEGAMRRRGAEGEPGEVCRHPGPAAANPTSIYPYRAPCPQSWVQHGREQEAGGSQSLTQKAQAQVELGERREGERGRRRTGRCRWPAGRL